MKKNALIAMVVSAALLLLVPQFLKNYGIYLLTYWLVFVIATMGLNLTVGYAGQKSLGQAAFFGIGANRVKMALPRTDRNFKAHHWILGFYRQYIGRGQLLIMQT